jgi:hypothetical protein
LIMPLRQAWALNALVWWESFLIISRYMHVYLTHKLISKVTRKLLKL